MQLGVKCFIITELLALFSELQIYITPLEFPLLLLFIDLLTI